MTGSIRSKTRMDITKSYDQEQRVLTQDRKDNIPEDRTENAAVIIEHSQIRIIRILIFSHLYHFGWTGRKTSNKRSIEMNLFHIVKVVSFLLL